MKTMNTDFFSDAGKKKKIETECIEIVKEGNTINSFNTFFLNLIEEYLEFKPSIRLLCFQEFVRHVKIRFLAFLRVAKINKSSFLVARPLRT